MSFATSVPQSWRDVVSIRPLPQSLYTRGMRQNAPRQRVTYGSKGYSLARAARKDFTDMYDHDREAFPRDRLAPKVAIVLRVRLSDSSRRALAHAVPCHRAKVRGVCPVQTAGARYRDEAGAQWARADQGLPRVSGCTRDAAVHRTL